MTQLFPPFRRLCLRTLAAGRAELEKASLTVPPSIGRAFQAIHHPAGFSMEYVLDTIHTALGDLLAILDPPDNRPAWDKPHLIPHIIDLKQSIEKSLRTR